MIPQMIPYWNTFNNFFTQRKASFMSYENIVYALNEKGLTVTFAESCTGGYLAKMITDIPGSSSVFKGSLVAYANEIKHSLLCVKQETLDLFGAVSPQTAREMATGARMLFNADIAVSVTGIAGPGGGSAEKPVGLVYVCIATKNTEKVYKLMASDKNGRCGVRSAVVEQVGKLLTELLKNE